MAEDLGEVRVRIEEEGAQDAADTIGAAVGEGGDGGGDGGGAGGGFGGVGEMLGGISTKLAGILGFVAFLATLKPIQELFKGLQRLFSIAILPLVSLLNTFLQPILQRLLRFIANLDFDNLVSDLVNKIGNILDQLPTIIADAITRGLSSAFQGAGSDLLFDVGQPERIQRAVEQGESRRGPFGTAVEPGSIGEDIFIQLGWLDEQANSSMESNIGRISSEETQRNGVGGQ